MPKFNIGDEIYHDYIHNRTFIIKNIIVLANGIFVYEMENCGLLMYENQIRLA